MIFCWFVLHCVYVGFIYIYTKCPVWKVGAVLLSYQEKKLLYLKIFFLLDRSNKKNKTTNSLYSFKAFLTLYSICFFAAVKYILPECHQDGEHILCPSTPILRPDVMFHWIKKEERKGVKKEEGMEEGREEINSHFQGISD